MIANFINAMGEAQPPSLATVAAVAALAEAHYRLPAAASGVGGSDARTTEGIGSGGEGLWAMDVAINDVVRLAVVHTLLAAVCLEEARRAAHAGTTCALPIMAAAPAALRAMMGVDVGPPAAGGGCAPAPSGSEVDPPAMPCRCGLSSMAMIVAGVVAMVAGRPLLNSVPDAPGRLVAALPAAACLRGAGIARGGGCVFSLLSSLSALAGVDPATLGRQQTAIGTAVRAYVTVTKPGGQAADEVAAFALAAPGGPPEPAHFHPHLYRAV